MLGKRVAFWGIIHRGDGPGLFPYVLIWGKSTLRMGLGFVSANSSKRFFNDGHLVLGSSENSTCCAYVSGVITYEYIDIEKDKQFKQDLLDGMPFPPKNGDFCLYNPQFIKILPKNKEKEFLEIVPHKVMLQPLTCEDKETLKLPYLAYGTSKLFKNYIENLRSTGN